jgi:hypothetical protein
LFHVGEPSANVSCTFAVGKIARSACLLGSAFGLVSDTLPASVIAIAKDAANFAATALGAALGT